MKNKVIRLLSMMGVVLVGLFSLTGRTQAADLVPKPIQNLFDLMGEDGSGSGEFATSRIRSLLLLGLGALVLAAVIYAAIAALKYIRSEGDPGQIEEAGKAVKAIFMGLAMMLIAIVGIVLVFVFFGAEFFGTSAYQTCLSAPNSQGCIACQAEGGAPVPVGAPFTVTSQRVGGASITGNVSNTPGAGGLPDDWDTVKFNAAGPGTTGTGNLELCTFCEWSYFGLSRGEISTVEPKCAE